MHSFFISTVNPPLFTRTDLEECPDDGESSVDEDPGLGDEQQQVVQLERGLGVVVQPPHLAQYSTVQYSTVQYSTAQYSTVQYSTVHYSTVQYSTVQYSTVQYSTVQYSTVSYSKL